MSDNNQYTVETDPYVNWGRRVGAKLGVGRVKTALHKFTEIKDNEQKLNYLMDLAAQNLDGEEVPNPAGLVNNMYQFCIGLTQVFQDDPKKKKEKVVQVSCRVPESMKDEFVIALSTLKLSQQEVLFKAVKQTIEEYRNRS